MWYFWWCCRRNLKLIALGSERVRIACSTRVVLRKVIIGAVSLFIPIWLEWNTKCSQWADTIETSMFTTSTFLVLRCLVSHIVTWAFSGWVSSKDTSVVAWKLSGYTKTLAYGGSMPLIKVPLKEAKTVSLSCLLYRCEAFITRAWKFFPILPWDHLSDRTIISCALS